MGTPNMIRVLSVSRDTAALTLESSYFPDQRPKVHLVSLTAVEAGLFERVLLDRPYGANTEHAAFVESLTDAAGNFCCSVRISSGGRRETQKIAISADTFVGLQGVFNSNIISDGYVDV